MPIAFVTGASSGFGEAITRRLVTDGFQVIAAARRTARLNALHRALGDQVLPWTLDVADRAAIAALSDALPAGWRDIGVLVNNAGLALGLDSADKADLADWDQMVATNITGLMHLTRAFLPGFVARRSGTIVNIGSTAGNYPYPGGNVYGASKAFVKQFSLNLRADLAGTGVRVTNLEPGMTGDSEFSQVRFKGDAERAGAVYDIAETVSWIIRQPPHVNVNRIEIMPAAQAPGPLLIKRNSSTNNR